MGYFPIEIKKRVWKVIILISLTNDENMKFIIKF